MVEDVLEEVEEEMEEVVVEEMEGVKRKTKTVQNILQSQVHTFSHIR